MLQMQDDALEALKTASNRHISFHLYSVVLQTGSRLWPGPGLQSPANELKIGGCRLAVALSV
jgi:hypothetical protein